MFEIIILVTGVIAFLSAILGWQIIPLWAAAGLFIAYGLLSFPYPKEDRHKVGLAVGCCFFALSGVLAITWGSWWPLTGGVVLGYGSALLLSHRIDGPPLSASMLEDYADMASDAPTPESLFNASIPPEARTLAKDNFEYIALNMALIRHALEKRWKDSFSDEKMLYKTCGVLDTIRHITDGHFTVQDVLDAMLPAQVGKCCLGLSSMQIEHSEIQAFHWAPSDLFLNYTLQIEAMIFNAFEQHIENTGMSEYEIVDVIVSVKERVARLLATPTDELEACELMQIVQMNSDMFMREPDWSEYRKAIGLES